MPDISTSQDLLRKRFALNLNRALDHIGVPPSGLGRVNWLCGQLSELSRPTASKWLTGTTMPTDVTRLLEITRLVGASVEQILSPEFDPAAMRSVADLAARDLDQSEVRVSSSQVATAFYKAQLDMAIKWDGDEAAAEFSQAMRDRFNLPENCRAALVTGDEMAPFVDKGEIVFYTPTTEYRNAGVYVLHSAHGGVKLRRIAQTMTGDFHILPENKRYPAEEYNKDWVVFGEQHRTGKVVVVGIVIGRLLWRV